MTIQESRGETETPTSWRQKFFNVMSPEHRSASPNFPPISPRPQLRTQYTRMSDGDASTMTCYEVERPTIFEIAKRFLFYGVTAVGGPPAHLATFQTQLVGENDFKHWVTNEKFAEMLALASSLPGPTSTQVAFGLGITQQGVLGGLTSGICFLLPGFFLMASIGLLAGNAADEISHKGSMFDKSIDSKFCRTVFDLNQVLSNMMNHDLNLKLNFVPGQMR